MVFDWPVVFAGSGQFHGDFSLFLFLQILEVSEAGYVLFFSLIIGVDVFKLQDG